VCLFILKQGSRIQVLIITNSNYSEIVSQFDVLGYMDSIDAVIYLVIKTIEVENKTQKDAEVLVDYRTEKIPKVIHYCWFSGNTIPDYKKNMWKAGVEFVRSMK